MPSADRSAARVANSESLFHGRPRSFVAVANARARAIAFVVHAAVEDERDIAIEGRRNLAARVLRYLLRSGEKLDEKWNYISENPVRAGLCACAEDYPYSGMPGEILCRLSISETATARTPNDGG